jgi:hypothetical protein
MNRTRTPRGMTNSASPGIPARSGPKFSPRTGRTPRKSSIARGKTNTARGATRGGAGYGTSGGKDKSQSVYGVSGRR